MREPVFLVAFLIAMSTIVIVVRTIAGAVRGRVSSRTDFGHLADQLDQQAASLEDAHNTLALQSAQLAELQERLDFAERLLAQDRPRSALKPGDDQA